MSMSLASDFPRTVPVFDDFACVADDELYRPLPEDWLLACADIVSSTDDIENGLYKAVNMSGVGVISAILNATGRHDLPFTFGGDGATVALPQSEAGTASAALSATRTWVAEEFRLDLRIAIVPVRDIRARGLDVRVALFRVGPELAYAMFTGGGASWAEAEMKAGRYVLDAAPAGARPDLTGLSCRWNPILARIGEIVSLIVLPPDEGPPSDDFRQVVADVVRLASAGSDQGHPLPQSGPKFAITRKGLDYEGRTAPPGQRLRRKLRALFQTGISMLFDRLGWSIGGYRPTLYRAEVARNTDFRKFSDGLRMTIDLDAAHLARLEAYLEEAQRSGRCRYGLHRQREALMTCFVPSPFTHDHMHFVDGAAGGYALAARHLHGVAA